MNTGLKVFLACAFGATLGTYVSLQVSPILWWIGLIVGGFVGYLSYEWKQVLIAVPRAWATATSWRPNREAISLYFKAGGSLAVFSLNIGIPLSLVLGLLPEPTDPQRYTTVQRCTYGSITAIGSSIAMAFLLTLALGGEKGWEKLLKALPTVRSQMLFWLWTFPKGFACTIAWCVRGIPLGCRTLYAGIIVLARFCKNLFILIHSELRLMCLVDAAIGVTIGHYFGHMLIGGLAGGIVGAFNFEIFSIRVLKLVPEADSIFS